MHRTTFDIPKMDCPSEERIIRMALDNSSDIKTLNFDLSSRQLAIDHDGEPELLLHLLEPLKFGARIAETRTLTSQEKTCAKDAGQQDSTEAAVLKQLLAINAAMFFVEVTLGWIGQSAGLIADSLDMFADAAVYGLSLYAVGRAIRYKRRAATISGYLQLVLALGAMFEVVRRSILGSEPLQLMMIGVATLALVANIACMALLSKHRTGGVHMKASWIFSTNDVIANAGVIVAGFLVALTSSPIPDLVIGALIWSIVFIGAIRILRIARSAN